MRSAFQSLLVGCRLSLAYRKALLVLLLFESSLLVSFYFLWHAVYASAPSGHLAGYSFQMFFSYLLLARFASRLTAGTPRGFFTRKIASGAIVYDLTLPVSLQAVLFWQHLGSRLVTVILLSPVLAAGFVLSHGHVAAGSILPIFVLSLGLAYCCSFYFEFLVSLVAFFTTSLQGIQEAKVLLVGLASGAFFPIELLPNWVKVVALALPFQTFVYAPARMFVTGQVEYRTLFTQAAWLAILAALSAIALKRARNNAPLLGG